MPMNTDGVNDMYYASAFQYDAYSQECWDAYRLKPDYDYTLNHFGGITDKEYESASKIIFTNGELDPWSGASPKVNIGSSLKTCVMPNGAHHLDLRTPNAKDPTDVIICRDVVLNQLKDWILAFKAEKE